MTDRRSLLMLATVYAFSRTWAREAHGIRLGVVTGIGNDADAAIARVRRLGFPTCFLSLSDVASEIAPRLKDALARYSVEATALESLGPGQMVWDLVRGPSTIGFVPPATRQARIDHLRRTSDLAAALGIPYVQTHCGFIPEVETDPLYEGAVAALRAIAKHCKANQQEFLMETGQETPVTLLRAIQDAGLDNIGVGLDTANLILYGKGNPVDALDVLGKYIRSVHAKDGLFPTNPRQLGREVPIGTGRVDFVRVISRLSELGYAGAISIEREISGPRQEADIGQAKTFLENIINNGAAV